MMLPRAFTGGHVACIEFRILKSFWFRLSGFRFTVQSLQSESFWDFKV